MDSRKVASSIEDVRSPKNHFASTDSKPTNFALKSSNFTHTFEANHSSSQKFPMKIEIKTARLPNSIEAEAPKDSIKFQDFMSRPFKKYPITREIVRTTLFGDRDAPKLDLVRVLGMPTHYIGNLVNMNDSPSLKNIDYSKLEHHILVTQMAMRQKFEKRENKICISNEDTETKIGAAFKDAFSIWKSRSEDRKKKSELVIRVLTGRLRDIHRMKVIFESASSASISMSAPASRGATPAINGRRQVLNDQQQTTHQSVTQEATKWTPWLLKNAPSSPYGMLDEEVLIVDRAGLNDNDNDDVDENEDNNDILSMIMKASTVELNPLDIATEEMNRGENNHHVIFSDDTSSCAEDLSICNDSKLLRLDLQPNMENKNCFSNTSLYGNCTDNLRKATLYARLQEDLMNSVVLQNQLFDDQKSKNTFDKENKNNIVYEWNQFLDAVYSYFNTSPINLKVTKQSLNSDSNDNSSYNYYFNSLVKNERIKLEHAIERLATSSFYHQPDSNVAQNNIQKNIKLPQSATHHTTPKSLSSTHYYQSPVNVNSPSPYSDNMAFGMSDFTEPNLLIDGEFGDSDKTVDLTNLLAELQLEARLERLLNRSQELDFRFKPKIGDELQNVSNSDPYHVGSCNSSKQVEEHQMKSEIQSETPIYSFRKFNSNLEDDGIKRSQWLTSLENFRQAKHLRLLEEKCKLSPSSNRDAILRSALGPSHYKREIVSDVTPVLPPVIKNSKSSTQQHRPTSIPFGQSLTAGEDKEFLMSLSPSKGNRKETTDCTFFDVLSPSHKTIPSLLRSESLALRAKHNCIIKNRNSNDLPLVRVHIDALDFDGNDINRMGGLDSIIGDKSGYFCTTDVNIPLQKSNQKTFSAGIRGAWWWWSVPKCPPNSRDPFFQMMQNKKVENPIQDDDELKTSNKSENDNEEAEEDDQINANKSVEHDSQNHEDFVDIEERKLQRKKKKELNLFLSAVKNDLISWLENKRIISPSKKHHYCENNYNEHSPSVVDMYSVDEDVTFHSVVGIRGIIPSPKWLLAIDKGESVQHFNENLRNENVNDKDNQHNGSIITSNFGQIGLAGCNAVRSRLRDRIAHRKRELENQNAVQTLTAFMVHPQVDI